jgi:hypothetical protein
VSGDVQEQAAAVLHAMDVAWAKKDVEGVVALFNRDATLESPLVVRFLKRKEGICRGADQIRAMIAELMRRGLPWGKHSDPIVRGHTVAVEFRSATDDQPFSVDVIELSEGKIQSLRAYTGWRALAQPE